MALVCYASTEEAGAQATYDTLYCDRICDYLYNHLAAPVNIPQVAAYVGLSAPYCCSVFKRHTGIPIIQYLNGLRINKAKEYIRSGGYSLKQAARMVGMDNYAYFCRIFKKLEQLTPSQFQKQTLSPIDGFIHAALKPPFHVTYPDKTERDMKVYNSKFSP